MLYCAIVGGIVACSEQAALLAPRQEGETALALHASRGSRAPVLKRAAPLKQSISRSVLVTPDGAVLSIEEAGLVVEFPRGAVDISILVTVTAQRGKDVVYHFEPHGLQFARAISIAQSLRQTKYVKRSGETEPDLHGGYLLHGSRDVDANGYAAFAETFSVSYSDRGKDTHALFLTTHFSGYSYASGRAGARAEELNR